MGARWSVISDIYGPRSLLPVFLISSALGLCSSVHVSCFTDFITILVSLPLSKPHIPVFHLVSHLAASHLNCIGKLHPASLPVCTCNVNMGKVWLHELVLGFLICNSEFAKLSGSYSLAIHSFVFHFLLLLYVSDQAYISICISKCRTPFTLVLVCKHEQLTNSLHLIIFISPTEKEQRWELWWRKRGGDSRESALHRWTGWGGPVHPQGLPYWHAHSQLVLLHLAQSSTEGWRGVLERLPLHPHQVRFAGRTPPHLFRAGVGVY